MNRRFGYLAAACCFAVSEPRCETCLWVEGARRTGWFVV